MILDNKLNITDAVELARLEEKLSKTKAHQLFNSEFLDSLEAGSFQALAASTRFYLKKFIPLRARCVKKISQKETFALRLSCI